MTGKPDKPLTGDVLVRLCRQGQRTAERKAKWDRPDAKQAAYREQHGIVRKTDAVYRRVTPPYEYLWNRNLLTDRQYIAARRLHEDWELGQGAYEVPEGMALDEDRVDEGSYGSDGGPTAAMLAAIERMRAVAKAIRGHQVGMWEVVQAVVVEGASVSTLADSKRAEDRRPYMRALRIGLDVTGDAYGMPSDCVRTKVFVEGVLVIAEVHEDADGTWRGRSLDGRRWEEEAPRLAELLRLAKAEVWRR